MSNFGTFIKILFVLFIFFNVRLNLTLIALNLQKINLYSFCLNITVLFCLFIYFLFYYIFIYSVHLRKFLTRTVFSLRSKSFNLLGIIV